MLEYLKNVIKDYELFSFDVFDTLCVLPYISYDDMFLHMSELYNVDNFKNIRKMAYVKAKENNDVTLDLIYSFIPNDLLYLKKKELDLLLSVVSCNKEIKEVFDYLSRYQKKIVITCDTYLPKYFIKKILKKCGYSSYLKIYISPISELTNEVSKIKSYNNISFDKIIHIGAHNENNNCKIRILQYTPPIRQLLTLYPFIDSLRQKYEGSFSLSLYIGILSVLYAKNKNQFKQCKDKSNYWKNMGAFFGGVLYYNFITFILRYCKKNKITDVLLVARDCYLLKKIFDEYNIPINTYYVYIPRKIALASTLALEKKFEYSFFDGESSLQALINYSQIKFDAIYSKEEGYNNVYDWYLCNKPSFAKFSNKIAKKIENYICGLNLKNKKNLAFVDTSTLFFSSQEAIKKAIPSSKISGLYLFINSLFANRFLSSGFIFVSQYEKYIYPQFVELFFSSPEPPIEDLDDNFNPIFKKDVKKEEAKKLELVKYLHEGILSFYDIADNIFKNKRLSFDNEFLPDLLENFINHPNYNDYLKFKDIKINFDIGHELYFPMFPNWEHMFIPHNQTLKYDFIEKFIDANLLNKSFRKFKECYNGKTIAIIATGPSLEKLKGDLNADIFISCNKAFLKQKNISFDYLFVSNKKSIENNVQELLQYKKQNNVIFTPDEALYGELASKFDVIVNNSIFQYIGVDTSKFPSFSPETDISKYPIPYYKSIGFQALQFALYTNPSKILLVGFDCTDSFNLSSNAYYKETIVKNDIEQIMFAKELDEFAKKNYKDTKIISINPVGLKHVFSNE